MSRGRYPIERTGQDTSPTAHVHDDRIFENFRVAQNETTVGDGTYRVFEHDLVDV